MTNGRLIMSSWSHGQKLLMEEEVSDRDENMVLDKKTTKETP